MSSPFSRSLPARPDLAQQKKQSKELLQAFTAGDIEARKRVRAALPDKEHIALADAQFVLAREYGFANWATLKRHIDERVEASRTPLERVHDAFRRHDANALRRLFETHSELRARINEPVFETFKVRVVWLIINLGTAVLAAMVIGAFEGTIAQMVTLAVLMPIVASMGGNAGTQTMAVAVRALATNQLTDANSRRAVFREVRISLLNGASLAVLIGLGVTVLFHSLVLGGVIGAAMMINNLVAGLAGMLIPIGLERAGVDPAVSSAVFVTMCTDIMGFFAFLGLATLVGVNHLV